MEYKAGMANVRKHSKRTYKFIVGLKLNSLSPIIFYVNDAGFGEGLPDSLYDGHVYGWN